MHRRVAAAVFGLAIVGPIGLTLAAIPSATRGPDKSRVNARTVEPASPQPIPGDGQKNRFLSFTSSQTGLTAIKITFASLHHVDPPYSWGGTGPFTNFEGQSQFVGPPTRYVESRATGEPMYAARLQCEPFYHNWSTIGLLHVTGEAVVPSSRYEVQVLADTCIHEETECEDISTPLILETARWCDVVTADYIPAQADFADVGALIDKFKNLPMAYSKSASLLVGENERGLVNPGPELNYAHVAVAVDAFRGMPYPHKPGMCSNLSTQACATDADCNIEAFGSGLCQLCGSVSGGACCRGNGTCDYVPAAACNGPNDWYRGDGTPCSRCCGHTAGCGRLTTIEWFDISSLWPTLDRNDVCKEAESDASYNCLAWSINETDEWIWDEVDVDRDGVFELSDFEQFFAGHQRSVIIYGGGNDGVLHTARPLPNNCASSKLGEGIRLRHDRNQIEGGFYGNILATYEY